jgi:hypothetical protein
LIWGAIPYLPLDSSPRSKVDSEESYRWILYSRQQQSHGWRQSSGIELHDVAFQLAFKPGGAKV